jgi:hypothetical protein
VSLTFEVGREDLFAELLQHGGEDVGVPCFLVLGPACGDGVELIDEVDNPLGVLDQAEELLDRLVVGHDLGPRQPLRLGQGALIDVLWLGLLEQRQRALCRREPHVHQGHQDRLGLSGLPPRLDLADVLDQLLWCLGILPVRLRALDLHVDGFVEALLLLGEGRLAFFGRLVLEVLQVDLPGRDPDLPKDGHDLVRSTVVVRLPDLIAGLGAAEQLCDHEGAGLCGR